MKSAIVAVVMVGNFAAAWQCPLFREGMERCGRQDGICEEGRGYENE